MSFGDDLGWGAGISATAADGPAPSSDLWAWLRQAGTPPGSTPGAGTSDEDLALLRGLGLRQVRLTADWSRLEPQPGARDGAATEAFGRRLRAARDAGLEPWVCLHDGPLPGWFSVDEHGFADRRARQYWWARHAELVGEAFGDLAAGWVPVLEPTRWAWRGWMDGTGPPGRRLDDQRFAEHLEGVLVAAVDAATRLRQTGAPVAAAHQIVPVFAARDHPDAPPTAEAEAAAATLDRTLNRPWLGIASDQEVHVPGRGPVPVPGGRDAFDVIGITYRRAVATRGDGSLVAYPSDAGRAWAEGVRLAVERVATDVADTPLAVAGMGVATADEHEREAFARDALGHLESAAAGGIDLRSIWWETPIDPGPGGGPRAGLFDHARQPRPAAAVVARAIAERTVPG